MQIKKILFINNVQYGTLVDSLKWCEQIHDRYKITYICFDDNKPRIDTPDVNVIYVPRIGGKKVRGALFLSFSALYSFFFRGFIFVIYFDGFGLLKKMLPFKHLHLDIRSLAANKEDELRSKIDSQIVSAAKIYDSVSAISEGVIKKMSLTKKVFLLPLGADVISETSKDFSYIKLLYVGTLSNRNIGETITGIKLFLEKHPDIKITYDIIGGDNGEGELEKLRKTINDAGLNNLIALHGAIPHNKLKPFFDKCNIGVSYVPITDYYQYQPPTKTFEYAFSGLATIATATEANKEVINDSNGVLIRDSAEEFCKGIELILKGTFNSNFIRNSVKEYSWENIVNEYLVPIIEQRKMNQSAFMG